MSFKPFEGELDAEPKFVPFDGELDGEPAEDLSKPYIGFKPPMTKAAQGVGEAVVGEGERLRDAVFSGVDNVRAGFNTMGFAQRASRVQTLQSQVAEMEARGDGDSLAAQSLRREIKGVQQSLPEFAEWAAGAQEDAKRGGTMTTTPVMQEMAQAKTFGEAWEAFKKAPYDVISTITAQSMPAILPALATAAVAGPVPGALAMGASSGVTEAGSSLGKFASDAGVDVTDPKALQEFFSNPENMSKAMAFAGKRAGIIAAADAVSGGVAGKIIAPAMRSGVARQAVNMPAQMGVQAGLGAGGEAGAQLATEGKISSPGEVLMEAVGELGGAPMEVATFGREARKAEQETADPIAAIAPAQTVDEAIVAATQVLDAQPVAAQAVANIERILGEGNVSTPTAVQPGDSGAAGGGMDLAAPGVAAGPGTDGAALPAVDARGPAAELPAADLPQPAGPDLDALRTENAALRAQAIQALESQQVSAAPAGPVPAARGDEPAAQLPAAGPAALEEGGVAAPPAAPSARQVAIDAEPAMGERRLGAIREPSGKWVAVDDSGNPIPESPKFDTGPAADNWKRARKTVPAIKGEPIDAEWSAFTPESGTKGVPRAEMPQIKAEHRGAMTNFLNARGIEHKQVEVPARDLKPTQAEFSPSKVEKAKAFEGGDRSILISADNHILDGHHQWLAKHDTGETVQAIRLDAPIEKLLQEVKEFPSAQTAEGATEVQTTPTAKEIDAKADQIMRLFDEMGGGIAMTREQVRALIVEKGMDAAEKSVQAFREKIRQDKATQAKLAKMRPATPQEATTAQPEPEAKPEPAQEKPVSQMSAADLLRAAADKMEGKAETPAANPAEPAKPKEEPASTPPKEEPQEPMLSRSEEIGQLPAVITPSTVERVQAAINELLGTKQLAGGLGRVVATTSAEIKSTWEPLIGKNVQIGSEAEAGVAQAFYDPRTKTVFMIADHINEGAETAVLAHELMHKHGQTVLGEAGWNRLHSLIGTWKDADEDSDERFVYDYATRKVQAVGQELSTQELFPYAVEAAIRMGIKPSLQAKRGTVANWLESVRQSLKTVWGRITGKPETFKAQDLVDLAFGIAQMENPEGADVLRGALTSQTETPAEGDIRYSNTEGMDMEAEQKALQALSESDDLFALPKSDKTTVAEIAAENDTDIKVRQTKIVNETLYTLTMPSGETAKLWVRPANPYSDQIYSMDLVDGDTSNVETGRPGENPEDVDPNIEDVYLDVSNLKPGQAGVIAYNIAATFAHNTGRIFIGDPSGLSDIAVRRRLENMISTALKFGTTNHIAPHPRQVKGAAGVPPLKWVYGDSLGNIRRMIDASLKAGENSGKPQLDYDTRTGNFSEEPARSALDAAGGRLEQVSGPAAGGLPRVQSAAESGIRTNKRAAIFRALLRETSEGRGGAQRGRDGILAGLVRVMDQFPGATKGIFYSRGSASPGQPGVTPPGGTPPATSAAQPNAWDLPPDTRTDRIIYDLQDGRVDLKRVQQAIKDAGNQVDELWDARLAETLYPGRVAHRSKQFLDAEVKPLLQAMALNKVEMDELSDYLHARGAEERNAQIAKVNPDLPDGGAGKNSKGVLMTNQAAKAYLATIGQSRKSVLDALAKRVDAITGGTRKLLVSEGLEKQETIDAWEAAYKNYVPMFRDEAESGAPHPQGMGFAVKGSASKRATGSTKQVTNMLAHVLMQREAAITRAEKNHVAMALYGLALSNPNPEFWTTIRPGMSDAKITAELQGMGVNPAAAMAGMERAPTIRTVDEATGKVVDRPNPMYRNLPGAIPLKVNGEDRVLMLNVEEARGQRLADNLKNLDGLTRLDIAGSIVGKTTRWLAAVNTQYNPVFGLKNVVRDVLGGTINLGSTELRGNALKVLRDTTPAMQGIARELAMPGKGGTWGKLWQQFQEDGGKTGWKENWRDPQERARAIEAELKAASSAGKLTPGKAAHAIFDLLDGFNTTLENSVRLSAYKAALDKGMSRAEAARLGRELTVDFNRKGRAGREISPLYAFFNASVQGTARTLETLKGPTGAKVIAGGLGLGILQALMLAMAGYDDDEIQEFVKAREFIIPLGVDEKGVKQHVKIPLPLGLHAIPNTGRILTEMALSGGKDLGAKSFKAVAEMAAAMNPLGGGDVTTLPGALTTLAPTVIDPLLELGFNKNFAGNAIEREKFRETDTRPGAARVKESTQRSTTGQAYLGISEAINAMTGGTKYEAGVISPTPERLRYLAQTVGGGVLRETEKIINGLTNTEPLKPNQIPVVGSFYGEVDDAQVQASRYFRNKDKTESAESSFEAMKKEGDGESMDRFIKDHPEVWNAKMLGRIQESITKMNKLAVTVINDPKTMKEIDETRTELMKLANEAVKEMEDAEANERGEGPTLGDRLRRRARKEVELVN